MDKISGLIELCASMANYDYLGGRDISEVVEKILTKAEILSYTSEGEFIAFISIYCNEPSLGFAYVNMLCVAPKSRRKGIAETLLVNTFSIARMKGFGKIRLEVHANNTGALRLYNKAGFKQIAKTPNGNLLLQADLA